MSIEAATSAIEEDTSEEQGPDLKDKTLALLQRAAWTFPSDTSPPCQSDPDLFTSNSPSSRKKARPLCRRCLHRRSCFALAILTGTEGTMAGTSLRERKQLIAFGDEAVRHALRVAAQPDGPLRALKAAQAATPKKARRAAPPVEWAPDEIKLALGLKVTQKLVLSRVHCVLRLLAHMSQLGGEGYVPSEVMRQAVGYHGSVTSLMVFAQDKGVIVRQRGPSPRAPTHTAMTELGRSFLAEFGHLIEPAPTEAATAA